MKRTAPLLAFLATLAFAPAAQAHPEDCSGKGESTDHSEEYCLSQAEIAKFDDSGAFQIQEGDTRRTKNLHLLANLPKSGPLAGDANLNSDIAFQGNYAYQGNYNGFQVTNIADPENPVVVKQVLCPGAQNDISVYGDLLVTSTDSSRNTSACENNVFQTATRKDSWEGLRLWDISDPANPRFVKAVETDCGSHTHTLVPDFGNGRMLIYVSSYSPNASFPDCQPPHDKISVVSVPMSDFRKAEVINEPVLFPDGGLPSGTGRQTDGCHDITVFPAAKLAAGACTGQGALFDISDPVTPKKIADFTDPNFAFWHSATFTHDAQRVLFTDELGGGGQPTCNPTIGPKRGADAMYDISSRTAPTFLSYFKIPRTQENSENCVAHNGIFLPTSKRDIYVQAWYQGGTSVVDFTDPTAPREIGFFERGPFTNADGKPGIAGAWSSYWYNGKIFVNDIQKGLDVLNFSGRERAGAGTNMPRLNAQVQEPVREFRAASAKKGKKAKRRSARS